MMGFGTTDEKPPSEPRQLEEKMLQRQEWVAQLDRLRGEIEKGLKEVVGKATIRTRVKSLESLVAKMRQRTVATSITDLLGMRIVVPFIEETEAVVDYLRQTQRVVEVDRKASSLSTREFGYSAIHLLIRPDAIAALQLPDGCSAVVEVQVRTTIQDAWAEVEHELIYKNTTLPSESMRKKMAALNATLSLSDTIFQEIRDQQKELALRGQKSFGEIAPSGEFSERDLPPAIAMPVVQTVGLEGALRKALNAHNRREYAEAIDAYSEALEHATERQLRSVLFNHRGLALSMLGRNHEALRDYGSSLQLDPNYGRALTNRGMLLRRLGYLEAATSDLLTSLGQTGIDKAENLYSLAQIYRELGDKQETVTRLRESLELRPDYAEAEKLLQEVRSSPVAPNREME